MPMILSAINVKLSSSHNKFDRRQTLDFFAQIINHATKAYDITDRFLDGINQILYLAYTITKELFLSDLPVRSAYSLTWADNPEGQTAARKGFHSPPPSHFAPQRMQNWVQGFLKHPRAYLRISATLDYAMAHGFLPSDECLPVILQGVTTAVFQSTRLPLMIAADRPHLLVNAPLPFGRDILCIIDPELSIGPRRITFAPQDMVSTAARVVVTPRLQTSPTSLRRRNLATVIFRQV